MYKQRDILIIPIPFTNLTANKKRPVVVLSNDHYNNKAEDIVVIAVTSNIERKEYSILISNQDLEEGVLPHQSIVRVDKIYTLNNSIVIKKLGVLRKETFKKVKDTLIKLINQNIS
ncbi:MAG TPA: type II toxin-antitoxin system PemK/MazF family toxin [Candidatus Brocadiia bacterium]|nr:type II toxin-antitoxin system PemK/MazF family toxin [Planctomycetota bacterium]MDO8093388.1 type II toxin-antitoxin system PemK/MazF family toxin [Candidatus Brocadiales bacterium]